MWEIKSWTENPHELVKFMQKCILGEQYACGIHNICPDPETLSSLKGPRQRKSLLHPIDHKVEGPEDPFAFILLYFGNLACLGYSSLWLIRSWQSWLCLLCRFYSAVRNTCVGLLPDYHSPHLPPALLPLVKNCRCCSSCHRLGRLDSSPAPLHHPLGKSLGLSQFKLPRATLAALVVCEAEVHTSIPSICCISP